MCISRRNGSYIRSIFFLIFDEFSQISLWEIVFLESRRRILPRTAQNDGKLYKIQKLEQIFGVTVVTLKNPLISYLQF
jgi:hypothetical protein